MSDVPDMDPRWTRLLAAARAWKATLIPNTSTGTLGPTNVLLDAITAFDEPCPHPRAQWIFRAGDERIECGRCGEWIVAS